MASNRTTARAAAPADAWADRYAALRFHGPGHASAWLGLPLAAASLTGMLWSVPVPDVFRASAVLNWGTLFLMAAFVYYCILSIALALGLLPILILTAVPSAWLARSGVPIWPVASALFATALAWQLTETKRATGRVRAVRNLQYLMIGLVWLVRAAYRRLGLKY